LTFDWIFKKLWLRQTHHEHPWTSTHQTNNGEVTLFKERKKYVCLVFYTRLSKTICEKNFCEWNWIWRHKCKIKHFGHTHFINCKGKRDFTIKSARFSKFFLVSTSFILKGFLEVKNWSGWTKCDYIYKLPFILDFTSHSKKLEFFEWFFINICS
jgi:hypothetical protein